MGAANFSSVPMIAASAVMLSGRPVGGGAAMARDDEKLIIGVILVPIIVLAIILVMGVVGLWTRTETKTAVNVKVVEAVYIKRSKSTQYETHFKLTIDGKYTWWSSDTVAYERCKTVQYNTFKPVWYTTVADIYGSSTSTSGMITFCGSAK